MNLNDPSHVTLNDLRELKTLEDVKNYTKQNYPGWIKGFADRYSDDYPHLTCTWVEMAKMMNAEPTQIMLVAHMPHPGRDKESSSVLIAICDIFSRSGFMLRRADLFQTCPVCTAILPTNDAFGRLTVKPPFEWSSFCRLCHSSSKRVEEVKEEDDLD